MKKQKKTPYQNNTKTIVLSLALVVLLLVSFLVGCGNQTTIESNTQDTTESATQQNNNHQDSTSQQNNINQKTLCFC